MNAVGKLGSYISRGVYTVSGPFHPFGGAVDIIVVQQHDGSFKSSPWYIRFGKFQGVLKSKENVVTISVNGVEAGFSMYLNNKGEAFFLRDSEAGEAEFVLSLPTSTDETEGRMKNGLFKKSQSYAEGGQRELVTPVDNGNGKIVTQTSSRRSTIFGLVFGRKSFKENDEGGNMEKVSSLERAEIAADLLEMKWSTNLTSGDQGADDAQVKPSENSETNVCVADKEKGPQTTLPNDGLNCDEKLNSHGERMGDNFGTGILNRSCSEEAKDNDPSCRRVSEEVIKIYTPEIGDKVNSDKKNSEFVFRNCVVDSQVCNLDIDGTFGDSVFNVEKLSDTHTDKMITEKKFEEIASHEEDVQIYTLEGCDSANRNKLMSELIPVHSNETDAQNPGLAACYDDTAQSLTESPVESTAVIPTTESGDKETTSFSYCETVENFNVSDDKSSEHLGLLSVGAEHCENFNMIPEVSSLSDVSSGYIISDGCHDQNLETSRVSESHVSQKSQYGYPRNGALEGWDSNGLNTESDPKSSSEQTSSSFPLLSNRELLSCEHEVNSVDVMTKESSHEKETNFQQIDLLGSHSQMEEREAAQIPSFPVSISSNPLTSGAAAESLSISEFPNSCNSSNVAQNIENFDVAVNLKRSYSFEEVNVAQDFGIISSPTEATEYSVPWTGSSDDVQFPFSDIDNFGAKEINTELPNNNKVVEAEDLLLTAECDVEEQDLQIKKPEQSLEGISDVLMSHSSPITIPGCKTSYGETELPFRSLPIIHSHIKDFEGYGLHHSLSCLLNSKIDNLDVLKNEDYSPSKLEAVPRTEVIHRHTSGGVDKDISAENEEAQRGNLTNATVELSLYKHLSFEGMGADAARQLFDAEKVNLEKISALGSSRVKNERLVRVGDRYFPWDAAAPIILGMICFDQEKLFEPQGMIPVDGAERKNGASGSIIPSRGSWNLWPFLQRSKTVSNAHATSEVTKEMDMDPASKGTRNMTLESDMQKAKNSKKVQSFTPTSEELASLNLKEGQNVVKFSFSTPMLGLQQVDARIYLWKWNTRIVISDVDGTITKSDVLGQFMPLVGIDWSQTGVAHLFSAIKDNGYQLLFLSARAISQAHLTRQFLFNLKQDGKALPDGPVFLSPDGLFPSLYREVIRRAPHEFKISCLEAIRALFPPDCNPFYAGFGNRDTDEISYLKVGIPMGKIFIINPKGQIAVNRQVDTRSYASLHELVNGIFPPMSSFEQEDYNLWNYWKLPLPKVDM